MKFSDELCHRQVHSWHILYPRKIGMIFTLDKSHGYEVVQCYKTTHFKTFEIVRKWTHEDIYSILLTLIALLTSILTLKVSFWFWIMKKNWVFSDLGRFSLIPHLNWGLGMIQIIIQSSICIIGDKLIIDRLTTRSALVPSRWPRMIRIASRLPRWSHELNLLHR